MSSLESILKESNLDERKQLPLPTESKDLYELVLDEGNDLLFRLRAIESLYKLSPQLGDEIVFFISSKFSCFETDIGRQFLILLIQSKTIPILQRIELVKNLYDSEEKEKSISLASSILTECEESTVLPIPFSVYFSVLSYIFTSEKEECILPHILWVISSSIKPDTLYKAVKSMSHNEEIIPRKEHILSFYKHIRDCEQINITFRMLACQLLMNIENEQEVCLSLFLKAALDKSIEYNQRADAVDLLLKHAKDDNLIKQAQYILRELSSEIDGSNNSLKKKSVNTIYEDRQNVHIDSIGKSVNDFLLSIGEMHTTKKFNAVRQEILELISEEKTRILVEDALLRIQIDNDLYAASQTLETILIKIWAIINSPAQQYPDTVKQRLIQELSEMTGTCGSGHVQRLVNSLSGFGFELNIGFDQQIKSNLYARIQKLISQLSDDKRDQILEELSTLDSIEGRPNLRIFLSSHTTKLYKELLSEFLPYISQEMFDSYFRKSIYFFETGENIE